MIHGGFLYAPLLCFQVGDGYNYGVYDYDVDTSVMKIKMIIIKLVRLL